MNIGAPKLDVLKAMASPERFHRTILEEHFRIKGGTKFYEGVDEMQEDLDEYMKHYNQERPHQGRNMKGKAAQRSLLKAYKRIPSPVAEPPKKGGRFRSRVSGEYCHCTTWPRFVYNF